ADPDGVATGTLCYAVNSGAWQSVPMSRTATNGMTRLAGTIPGQGTTNVVQFYVQAVDGLGAASAYPAGGTNSRALYDVAGGAAYMPRVHTVRLILTPDDVTFVHAHTNVMSNEKMACTIIDDERKAYYDGGVHLQSSERGRDVASRVGYTVYLPSDRLFRGVHDSFTVDRSGGYSGNGGDHDEILLKNAVNKAGGLPGMYDDLIQFFSPRTNDDSTGLLIMAKYGSLFLDTQYPEGSDGELYKLALIYYPTTPAVSGDVQAPKLPQPDAVLGTDIKNLGDDPEAYRWTFLKENHSGRNNYAPMMALAKAFSQTNIALLDSQTRACVDVDEWLRGVAFLSLIGITDMYSLGNSHNLIIYFRPEDSKGMAFLWDMDYSYLTTQTNQAFPGSNSATTYNLITKIPANLRAFYGHLLDLSTLTGDTAYMGAWSGRYSGLVTQDWSKAVNFLAIRAATVRSKLPLSTPFALTNPGANFAVTNDHATLSGTAAVGVSNILINGLSYPLVWNTVTNWSASVPLFQAVNSFSVQGVNRSGLLMTNALVSTVVTNLGLYAPRPVVINEWMADNAGPAGYPDPADGLHQDWFELYNPNDAAVNLTGYHLTDDLAEPAQWPVPTNTVIGPRGFLLVWADNEEFQNGPGTNGDLHANFKLNNAGETIGLYAADGTWQHAVAFGDQIRNVSQGLYPDGDTNSLCVMTNWTPRAANQSGPPVAPDVLGMAGPSESAVTLSLPATAGHAYVVEFTDDLSAGGWTPLSTNRATADTIEIVDPSTNVATRFYRAVLLQ
ncbi:MAG: lamin tail domain-containing protein, partial [Acidobacteria bacterium]|nr:lamin tail domain-containing protein [Acidobacteriota bacterium]